MLISCQQSSVSSHYHLLTQLQGVLFKEDSEAVILWCIIQTFQLILEHMNSMGKQRFAWHRKIWSWVLIYLKITFPRAGVTSAGVGAVHGVQVRKPQGRDVLRCYVGASSVENIRVSALLHSVGFTFIFLFEQEVAFFSAKSLKVNPNLAACRRMVMFQKQHSCPRERERGSTGSQQQT